MIGRLEAVDVTTSRHADADEQSRRRRSRLRFMFHFRAYHIGMALYITAGIRCVIYVITCPKHFTSVITVM